MSVQFSAQPGGEFEHDVHDMVVDDDPSAGEVRMYPLQYGTYRRSIFACPQNSRRECNALILKLALLTLLVLAGFLVGYYSTKPPDCQLATPLINYDQAIVDQSGNLVDAKRISDAVQQLSKQPHLSGTPENEKVYDWIYSQVSRFSKFPFRTYTYNVLLQHPTILRDVNGVQTANTVELVDSKGNVLNSCSDCAPLPSNYTPFTAFSGPGEFEGEPVFVNFGTVEDFEKLRNMSIDCSKKVLIAKIGAEPRGAIAYRAITEYCRAPSVPVGNKRLPVLALLVYPDPAVYPLAYANETSSGVNRYVEAFGDLRTPLLPSVDNVYRDSITDDAPISGVLVQPITWKFAAMLMKNMNGTAVDDWKGRLTDFGIQYAVGPGYISSVGARRIRINLTNKWSGKLDDPHSSASSIRNLISVVPGSVERDRYVIIGAHYDALTLGARDNGGSVAVLLEIMRVLHEMYVADKWKPYRTIVFALWDGEEYGQIGSTEFIEELGVELQDRAVAYVNLDGVVSGTNFFMANEHPFFFSLLLDVASKITWPGSHGTSVAQRWILDVAADWAAKVPAPGGLWTKFSNDQKRLVAAMIDEQVTDSDIVSWWTERGVPFIGPRFVNRAPNLPAPQHPALTLFPRPLIRSSGAVPHSSADTFDALQKMDPDWSFHVAMTRLIIGLTHRLVDSVVLPINPSGFAAFTLVRYDVLTTQYKQIFDNVQIYYPELNIISQRDALRMAFVALTNACAQYSTRASSIDLRAVSAFEIRRMNERVMLVDHAFDTPYNEKYRTTTSTLFAPDRAYEKRTIVFPGVRRALDQLATITDLNEKQNAAVQLSRELSILYVGTLEATRLLAEQDSFFTD